MNAIKAAAQALRGGGRCDHLYGCWRIRRTYLPPYYTQALLQINQAKPFLVALFRLQRAALFVVQPATDSLGPRLQPLRYGLAVGITLSFAATLGVNFFRNCYTSTSLVKHGFLLKGHKNLAVRRTEHNYRCIFERSAQLWPLTSSKLARNAFLLLSFACKRSESAY